MAQQYRREVSVVCFLAIQGAPTFTGTFQPGQHHQLSARPRGSHWTPRPPQAPEPAQVVGGGGVRNCFPLALWLQFFSDTGKQPPEVGGQRYSVLLGGWALARDTPSQVPHL